MRRRDHKLVTVFINYAIILSGIIVFILNGIHLFVPLIKSCVNVMEIFNCFSKCTKTIHSYYVNSI
jgi:hypothetical protein